MNEPLQEVGVLEATPPPSVPPVPAPPVKAGPVRRAAGAFGVFSRWRSPSRASRASSLSARRPAGAAEVLGPPGEDGAGEGTDWCEEHGVPESDVRRVQPGPSPAARRALVVQGARRPRVPALPPGRRPDADPAARHRRPTGSGRGGRWPSPRGSRTTRSASCTSAASSSPRRRSSTRLGHRVAPVDDRPGGRGGRRAPGEIGYDPTRVARLVGPGARAPSGGSRSRSATRSGGARCSPSSTRPRSARRRPSSSRPSSRSTSGGRRSQALTEGSGRRSRGRTCRRPRPPSRRPEVRLLTAEQALANLGLPLRADDVRGLSPADLARRMQFLGLPDPLAPGTRREDRRRATSSRSPPRSTARWSPGRPRRARRPTPTKAAVRRRRHQPDVAHPPGPARRTPTACKPGQPVRFRHAGHAADRVGRRDGGLGQPGGRREDPHRAGPGGPARTRPAGTTRTRSGPAQVVLREETDAVVVPSEAVHWEG